MDNMNTKWENTVTMGFCGLKLQANGFSILPLLLQEEVSGEAPRVAPESEKKNKKLLTIILQNLSNKGEEAAFSISQPT